MMFPSCALTMFPMVSRRGSTFVFFFFFFSLSHSMKASQSTDARSEAFGKGGACGVEAPEPHLYLLASPRRPICEWIHLNTFLDEPRERVPQAFFPTKISDFTSSWPSSPSGGRQPSRPSSPSSPWLCDCLEDCRLCGLVLRLEPK